MVLLRVRAIAEATNLCVGLTYDPSDEAEPNEKWIAAIGLDVTDAGSTPDEAILSALHNYECNAHALAAELDTEINFSRERKR